MVGSARLRAAAVGGLAVAALALAPLPAAARGFVHFGIGFGAPLYYYPPPVYYAPPPVYYVPAPGYPPPVAYGPPAVYGPPAAAGQCREYTTTSIVGGQPQQLYGTACLQPDGTWRIVR
ncbi:MAG TPA: hypothetical protein VFA50_19710 [Stellaceae bacterium]|nr:hypothetical protein [Stellaceae bacterium]